MQSSVLQGILLPFWGTSLGAACVFCLRRAPSAVLRRVLEGFAAGVMTAASVWSLLLPAIDWADMGRWSFLPAAGGFWLGVLFLRLLERLLPEAVTDRSTTMTLLAVTLHNIPEGMAVGAAYAGCVAAGAAAPAAAFTLALAIAIQNVPEGAIVALPLRTAGAGKGRAFLGGVLSGVVEPLAAGDIGSTDCLFTCQRHYITGIGRCQPSSLPQRHVQRHHNTEADRKENRADVGVLSL